MNAASEPDAAQVPLLQQAPRMELSESGHSPSKQLSKQFKDGPRASEEGAGADAMSASDSFAVAVLDGKSATNGKASEACRETEESIENSGKFPKANASLESSSKSWNNEHTPAGHMGPSSNESSLRMFLQVVFPYILSGYGTAGGGLIIDKAQDSEAFRMVPGILVLVPPLMGMKANLEMSQAARVSTQVQTSSELSKADLAKMAIGNLSVNMCHACTGALVASILAVIKVKVTEGQVNPYYALLLCGSSMASVALCSLILGSIMFVVVVYCAKMNINPDNVATPVAGSLGDISALGLFAGFSILLYMSLSVSLWIVPVIFVVSVFATATAGILAFKNAYIGSLLYKGAIPVIIAVIISSFSGYILDTAAEHYPDIAAFQPVINGIGGNSVAILVSRISTYLNSRSEEESPESNTNACMGPVATFCRKDSQSKMIRILLLLNIPGHILFATSIHFIKGGHTAVSPLFLVFYCAAGLIQVTLLLYVARPVVYVMWKRSWDPDTCAIPMLTSTGGDLMGAALLTAAYVCYYSSKR